MLISVNILFFTFIKINIVNCLPGIFTDFLHYTFPHVPTSLFGSYDTSKEISAKIGEEEFDFITRVKHYGYTAEEYTVVSKDGYNLILHRISGSPIHPKAPGKKVVYLQHGLAMYTINYILRGPGRDLVFLLADAGYDVWMGNVRGNALSRSNNNVLITNSSFWNFSYHEVALNDVSAFIDETLNITEQDKLVYIGFSLGTTESFVLLSSSPEYNEKISLLIELAPVAFWKNNDKFFINSVSNLARSMESLNGWFDIQEVFPLKSSKTTTCNAFCQQFSNIIMPKFDTSRYDQLTLSNYEETYPAGTSAKTIFHLSQNIQSGSFEEYNYGISQNIKIYGSEDPPKYMLNKITVPTALFYSHNDAFTTDMDIQLLKSLLPNVVACKRIPYPMFTHLDFMWANDAKTEVYDDVLELISKYV